MSHADEFGFPDVDKVMQDVRDTQDIIERARLIGDSRAGDLFSSTGFLTSVTVMLGSAQAMVLALKTLELLPSELSVGDVKIMSAGMLHMSAPLLLCSQRRETA